ncbi:MAG: galactose-1-phosphate uridylyltransferase [bacterium]
MPELRKDPVSGHWVIVSKEREKRPTDLSPPEAERQDGFCPFCPGNEEATPPEVLAYRPGHTGANSPGWDLRVVPNKFPALQVEGALRKYPAGMFDMMTGVGAHEVIIESPDHLKGFHQFSPAELARVICAFRDRIHDLKNDIRFEYIMIFKNHGSAAGATLFHSHTQLIALPVVPKQIREEMRGAGKFMRRRGRCLFCDIIYQEKEEQKRVICRTGGFVALAPYASRFPFEVWVLPEAHQSHFEEIGDTENLALTLKTVFQKLTRALGSFPYNLMVHTAPLKIKGVDSYHWHIEIIPRLTQAAGFEWGTGFHINPTPPEDAAAFLREAEESS